MAFTSPPDVQPSTPKTLHQPESAPVSETALPGIKLQHGFQFRKGQQAFLEALSKALEQGEENHLGVFVPGYGKTITALASFIVAHHLGYAQKLVVFVPRGNLRDQYADPQDMSRLFKSLSAPPFSFCVADSEQVFLKNLDTQIIITTYQYASGVGGHKALQQFCRIAPCMFVFDEVHHLADDGLWASKIEALDFACSVALSGTPMRSDNKTLFGVPFEAQDEESQFYVALHEVTMRDAHEEGEILKRVAAHVVDYRLRMVRADTGEEVELSLSEMREMAEQNGDVDTYLARRKLRFHEVYLSSLLEPAFTCFTEKRRSLRKALSANGRAAQGPFRNHQMLIIAMSNRHAAAILAFVEAQFSQFISARIGQDVPARERADLLEKYRNGDVDVMVQVDMIGEGTDIKPISVIVKADLVRAHSKTLQQVFRGMRYFDGFDAPNNLCDIYASDDAEVVHVLSWIASEEQLGVRRRKEQAASESPPPPPGSPSASRWELAHVEHHRIQSHGLELHPGLGTEDSTLRLRELHRAPPRIEEEDEGHAVDVRAQERQLRKACAELASELSFVLVAEGHPASIREIHAEAKRRLSKAQHQLSIKELEKKHTWLTRCLRYRRMV